MPVNLPSLKKINVDFRKTRQTRRVSRALRQLLLDSDRIRKGRLRRTKWSIELNPLCRYVFYSYKHAYFLIKILQKQMADIKLQYAQLPATDSRRIKLENDAATIKVKYQKILDLRNENRSRLANSSSTTFSNQAANSNLHQIPPRSEIPPPKIPPKMNQPEIHTNHHLTHRRVLSDPSTIQEIQNQQMQQRQNQISSSQTFTTGLSAFQQPPMVDNM